MIPREDFQYIDIEDWNFDKISRAIKVMKLMSPSLSMQASDDLDYARVILETINEEGKDGK